MDGEEQAGETAPIGKPVTQLEAHMNSLRAKMRAIDSGDGSSEAKSA